VKPRKSEQAAESTGGEMPEDPPGTPDSPCMDWRAVVAAWQELSPDEQLQRRLARIPEKVARSMAFAGEPVNIEMLKRYLHECIQKDHPHLIEKEQEE